MILLCTYFWRDELWVWDEVLRIRHPSQRCTGNEPYGVPAISVYQQYMAMLDKWLWMDPRFRVILKSSVMSLTDLQSELIFGSIFTQVHPGVFLDTNALHTLCTLEHWLGVQRILTTPVVSHQGRCLVDAQYYPSLFLRVLFLVNA